jgi:hypothetical protein
MSCSIPTPDAMFTSVTVTRAAAGSYVDGRWVAGSTSTLTVTASAQPHRARPDELLHLPEADRTRESLRLYTETELQTADEETQTPADLVTWDGEQWEVVRVESWPLGLAHYKAIALRVAR